MPYSEDVEKRIQSFDTIADIVSAMKAYAGVTIRKTEQIVPNVREYEKNVLFVLSDLIVNYPDLLLMKRNREKRIIVAFGSSQGLCGAYNEKVADAVAEVIGDKDVLFVIGRRLSSSLLLRHIAFENYSDSVLSVSGIQAALEKTIVQIMDIYRKNDFYNLTFIFTSLFENKAQIAIEQILPPDINRMSAMGPECRGHFCKGVRGTPLYQLLPVLCRIFAERELVSPEEHGGRFGINKEAYRRTQFSAKVYPAGRDHRGDARDIRQWNVLQISIQNMDL
jgi:hypothetical protein